MATALWTEAERAEMARVRRLRLLYEGRHEAYFVLPSGEERRFAYVTVNWLGDVLSPMWTRLLFRRFPMLTAEGDAAQRAAVARLIDVLDLPGLCLPTALAVSYAGRAVWKLYWSRLSERPVAQLWGVHESEEVTWEYFPADPSRPYAVNFWYAVLCPRPGGAQRVMVRERHQLLVNEATGAVAGVRMTNTAHPLENGVPLAGTLPWAQVWPDAATRPPACAETPGLTELPAVEIHNTDRDGDRRGDSDYTASLIALQQNLNKLVAVRQLVIDLSEQPQLIVPESFLDADGGIDWAKVRLRVRYPGEEGTQEIRAINWSGNLENSGAQWEYYRTEFQALTGIAPALFGVAGGSGESGYARRLAMVPTEAEVGARRRPWETAFTRVLRVAMMLERACGDAAPAPVARITTTWPPAIPDDPAEVSATARAEYQAGVRSLASTVRRLNPEAGDDQLADELAALRAG